MSVQAKQLSSSTGPMVLVYIGDDDPSRGDSHGFKGIGQRMAQKLNGRFHYLEDKHLGALYPGIQISEGLDRYMQEHGRPDILLSRAAYYGGMMTRITPLMMVKDINEGLSEDLLGDSSLVSHHLTPEIFDEHGARFRDHYKDIKTPIIAVMLVNIWDTEQLAEKMVSKCAQHDEPLTVFICSSRRTGSGNYELLKKNIEDRAREKGLGDRLHVEGYNFEKESGKENVFNPYIGLIKEAEHILVAGESLSMVSEPLAAGKRVMVHQSGHSYTKLKKKGLVIDFDDCAADTRFETPHVGPVNVTEDISNRLVEKFNRVAAKNRSPLGWLHRQLSRVKNSLSL